MFYSGEGSIKDISFDNPDFNTSGRNTLKLIVEQDLEESPTFGKGPRADIALYGYFNFKKAILHNDYLLLRHSYGYVGLFLYLGALFFQFLSLFKLRNKVPDVKYLILWGSAMTLFIPYLGFMYSDNIYLYGPFYSHLHFAIIGIIYSMSKKSGPTSLVKPVAEVPLPESLK